MVNNHLWQTYLMKVLGSTLLFICRRVIGALGQGKCKMYQKHLVSHLKHYRETTDMDASYMAGAYPPCLTDDERAQLFNGDSFYRYTIRLRRAICQHLSGRFDCHELNFWIVQKWGGIFNFGNNTVNRERIESFGKALNDDKKVGLESIASLSKIASFINPDRYFVYDSRSVYSLDLILLNSGYSGPFFPIPQGRGDQTKTRELLMSIRQRIGSRKAFYPRSDAYYQYCELLRKIAPKVYEEPSQPERLEMLLFVIADFL